MMTWSLGNDDSNSVISYIHCIHVQVVVVPVCIDFTVKYGK